MVNSIRVKSDTIRPPTRLLLPLKMVRVASEINFLSFLFFNICLSHCSGEYDGMTFYASLNDVLGTQL
jgi:hypothetical protein